MQRHMSIQLTDVDVIAMLGVCPGPASASTASAAWAAWRCARPGAGRTSTFVHVNELNGDAATAAHLLTFDSVHGRWDHDVQRRRRRRSRSTARRSATAGSAEPGDVPWGEHGVEVVLECSGKFRTREALDAVLRARACAR